VDNLLISKQSVCANDARKREREKKREKETTHARARVREWQRERRKKGINGERQIYISNIVHMYDQHTRGMTTKRQEPAWPGKGQNKGFCWRQRPCIQKNVRKTGICNLKTIWST